MEEVPVFIEGTSRDDVQEVQQNRAFPVAVFDRVRAHIMGGVGSQLP